MEIMVGGITKLSLAVRLKFVIVCITVIHLLPELWRYEDFHNIVSVHAGDMTYHLIIGRWLAVSSRL